MSEDNANEEKITKKVEEKVSEAEKSMEKGIESAKAGFAEKLGAFMSLKEKNPKLFYGIIAVLGIPLLIMMFGGGEPENTPVSGPTIKELQVGQKYTLKAPNTVDPSATIRLVPVPGTLAAYDDTEEDDRKTPCQHMPIGTPVEVMEFSDFGGKRKMFVKVKIADGECKDKDGWVLAIDVQ